MVKHISYNLIFLTLLMLCPGPALFPAGQPESSPQKTSFIRCEKNPDWLLSMLRPVKKENRDFLLMQSYGNLDNRCWIYDQALAVFVLTALKEREKAKKILDTLAYIRNDDGSFYFSYLISTLEPTSQRKYTGSIAWVVMAINFYREMTGDTSYRPLAVKILKWLASQQVTEKNDPRRGGLSLGTRDDLFSMEHNIDSYSAFRYSGIKSYKKRAKAIKKFILRHLYHKEQRRFLTGYLDNSKYLDCQSWAVLAFGKKYAHVLEFAERHFLVEDGKIGSTSGIRGFFERNAENAPVWSEGTAGAALAYYFIKDKKKGDSFHREIEKMAGPQGGIRYATENDYEFSISPSIAGTAWFIFYEMKLNPFKIGRKTKRSLNKYKKKHGASSPEK
jgi:hypothetical protein